MRQGLNSLLKLDMNTKIPNATWEQVISEDYYFGEKKPYNVLDIILGPGDKDNQQVKPSPWRTLLI